MVKTQRLEASDEPALVEEAAAVLRGGGLVLLPTETVYGLAGRGDDPAVVERLRDAKGRDQRPFARLVAGLADVEASGATLAAPARRLARRFWPGPLTLVLDGPDGETLGFRVPGLAFAREVVARAGVPVLATSANRSGDPAAVECEAAVAAVGHAVDLAVDGGRTQLTAPSTVVRVPSDGPVTVLREGFLDSAAIERTVTRLIVFVCTGNTCRSPMAAAIFARRLAERLDVEPERLGALGWKVASAGVAAGEGGPAADHAVRVMREDFRVDISDHRSRPVSPDLAEAAERLVALGAGHARGLAGAFPAHADKVVLLDPLGVPDPVGADVETYRATADLIAARIDELIDELLAEPDPPGRDGPFDPARLFAAPDDVPERWDLRDAPGADRYLVAGEVRRWEGPRTPVLSVYCEPGPDGALRRRELAQAAALDGATGRAALDAAVAAWDLGRGPWPTAPLRERVQRLRAFAEAARGKRDEVVRLLMWEVGKSHADAAREFDRTIDYLDATVYALVHLSQAGGIRSDGGVLAHVGRAPLGVCLCMGPFNYPVNETYTTLIPALAVGNTAVVKLPKHGVLANLPLLEPLAEHFPPGVVNVVQGDGAELVEPMMRSGQVDVLAFIGSSRVAGVIEKQHPAPYRLQTILGMDAKNPAVVLPDADLDVAVRACVEGALSFNGQRCTALKVLFVHRSLADAFVERLAAAVEDLPAGMMWERGVELTPLPEVDKVAALAALVDDAVASGARVVNPSGGRAVGTFFFPAVLYPVAPEARLYGEEQFGPLVPVVPFDDVDEVHRYIAESPYGQQVSLFGQDPAVLGPLIDRLANQVCRINLNRQCQRGPDSFPFTGRKDSAEGTLSIVDALEAFSIPSLVAAGDDAGGQLLLQRLLETGSSEFLRPR